MGDSGYGLRPLILKGIITWAIVLFIASYLIFQPAGAANVIHGLLDALRAAGTSLATFVNSL